MSWVMRMIAGAVLPLQLSHQLQHLRLHGDVERRRRLVGDQHLGAAGQRHGDHHPLAHAAGQLVRNCFSRSRLGDLHRFRASISAGAPRPAKG
jgi:hypothetical protein